MACGCRCLPGWRSRVRVELPWPPKELSPNARLHWAALARAKRDYRHACLVLAKKQGVMPLRADALDVSFTFHAPTRRAYDLDNALARMKAGVDALAHLLQVDDSRWAMRIERGEPRRGGRVVVDVYVGGGKDGQ